MVDVAKLLATLHPMREPPPPYPILPIIVMALAGCIVAAGICAAIWLARRREGTIRRAAVAALAASRSLAPTERLAAQAQLLRRLARRLAGDGEARKQGRAWLESLDRLFTTHYFTEGEGSAFGEALYRPTTRVDVDRIDQSLAGLLTKVRV